MSGITDPAEAHFDKGLWAWDGTVWRKQTQMFGYESLAGEDVTNSSLSAGFNNLDTTAVASGFIEVVTQIGFSYVGTVPTSMNVRPLGTPGTPVVLAEYSIVSNAWYYTNCFLVLAAGDQLRCRIAGATGGDLAYFRYLGYKMAVAD